MQFRATLDLAPDKTNPLGERKQVKTCLVDTTPGATSSGRAVRFTPFRDLHRSMLEDTEQASLSKGRSTGGTLGPANGPALGAACAR